MQDANAGVDAKLASLRNQLVQERAAFPIHCSILASNGAMVFGRYDLALPGAPDWTPLAEHAEGNGLTPPLHLVYVAADRTAYRAVIEAGRPSRLARCATSAGGSFLSARSQSGGALGDVVLAET